MIAIARPLLFMLALVCSMPCALPCASPVSAHAADWEQTAQATMEQAQQRKKDAAATRKDVQTERTAMRAELARLRTAASTAEKRFGTLDTQLKDLLAREDALKAELAEQAEELKTVEGAVRTSAKGLDSLLDARAVPGPDPQAAQRLQTLLDTVLEETSFPGIDAVTALSDAFFKEMGLSRTLLRTRADIVTPDGRTATADILQAGMFTGYYRLDDGTVGFLTPGPGLVPVAAKAPPASWMRSAMEDAFAVSASATSAPDRISLPIDISHGAAFARLAQSRGVAQWLESGGVLVWPIVLVALAALLLGAERMFALFRLRQDSRDVMGRARALAAQGKLEDCRALCAGQRNIPACRVAARALEAMNGRPEVAESALQEALLAELPPMERFLPTLSVLAAVAPLLGLLGTVTGMIETFHSITIFGTGDPRMLSGGISEALVTTQLGLGVAVPVLVLHHFLERRVDNLLADMEEKGAALAVALRNGLESETDENADTESRAVRNMETCAA